MFDNLRFLDVRQNDSIQALSQFITIEIEPPQTRFCFAISCMIPHESAQWVDAQALNCVTDTVYGF